ncbi:hypothetical protein D3C74_288530 [compost metagenome]
MLLSAGIRAADKVDSNLLVQSHMCVQVLRHFDRALLRFHDGQVAKFIARAGDGPAHKVLRKRR